MYEENPNKLTNETTSVNGLGCPQTLAGFTIPNVTEPVDIVIKGWYTSSKLRYIEKGHDVSVSSK
jgi:hypothetical protein